MHLNHDWFRKLQHPLQVILFDLDGTLRHSQPKADQALFDYAIQLGVADESEKRRQAARWAHYYWAQSPELLQDIQTFQEMEAPFWTHYAMRSLLSFGCSPECAQELAPQLYRYYREEYQPEDIVLPDVPVTLELLKSTYRLGLLSNRIHPCHEVLQQLDLHTYFEMTLAAGETDAWKPDPRLFQHALQRMDTSTETVPPEQAVYVGDNYYSDIIGARSAGLQAVLLDPDGIFPEVDCPVIHQIGDLQALVDENSLRIASEARRSTEP